MEEFTFKPPTRPEKISDQIIAQIRDIILAGEFKPGDKLGSEKELIAQFGVSKGTLREALRVLEAMGLVEIRKGLTGGVFIAEVDMKTTIHSIINFLHFKAVSIKDITMLRFFLEPFIVRITASNITEEDIGKLRHLVTEEVGEPRKYGDAGEIKKGISFHRYLARLTHNPILILIMDFVDNLLTDMKAKLELGPDFYVQVKEAHRKVLDKLSKGDAEGAEKEILSDLLSVGKAMAQQSNTEHFDPAVLGLGQNIFEAPANAEMEIANSLSSSTSHLSSLLEQATGGKASSPLVLKHMGSGDLYLILLRNNARGSSGK